MEIFKCWNSQMRKYLSYDIRCFFYYIKLLLFLLTILFFVQGAVFEFGQVSPAILTHIMRIKISNGQIFWYLGLHYTSHPRSWHVTLWLYYTTRKAGGQWRHKITIYGHSVYIHIRQIRDVTVHLLFVWRYYTILYL